MTDTSLAKKLGIRPGHRVLVLNPPDGYLERLTLPDGVTLAAEPDEVQADVVQAFAPSRAELDRIAATAMDALAPGGILWFSHLKRSSGIQTDLTRDKGWDAVLARGLEGIASVSIDDVWSGVRFRPSADVRRRSR